MDHIWSISSSSRQNPFGNVNNGHAPNMTINQVHRKGKGKNVYINAPKSLKNCGLVVKKHQIFAMDSRMNNLYRKETTNMTL